MIVCAIALPETATGTPGSLRPRAILGRYGALVTRPPFFWPALLSGLPSCGIFAYFAGSPLVFMEILGLTASEYGVLPAIAISGILAGTLTVDRLSGRLPVLRLLMLGAAFMSAPALALLLLALADALTVAGIVACTIVYLYGMGVLIPSATGLSLQSVSSDEAGAAGALTGFAQMGFAAVGALAVSLLPAWPTLGFPAVMTLAGLAAGVLVLRIAALTTSD